MAGVKRLRVDQQPLGARDENHVIARGVYRCAGGMDALDGKVFGIEAGRRAVAVLDRKPRDAGSDAKRHIGRDALRIFGEARLRNPRSRAGRPRRRAWRGDRARRRARLRCRGGRRSRHSPNSSRRAPGSRGSASSARCRRPRGSAARSSPAREGRGKRRVFRRRCGPCQPPAVFDRYIIARDRPLSSRSIARPSFRRRRQEVRRRRDAEVRDLRIA